jgi:hypothetical protein
LISAPRRARALLSSLRTPPIRAAREEEEKLAPGKRYAVFAIRSVKGQTIWVRAGVAFVQPDDSMNLMLDVLPLDGHLHIREQPPKHQQTSSTNTNRREEPAAPVLAAPQSMGGH